MIHMVIYYVCLDAFHDKNDAKAATFTLDNLVQLTMYAWTKWTMCHTDTTETT